MSERADGPGLQSRGELLAALPAMCRPARAADDPWHFVPSLSRRLLPFLPHEALQVGWLAEDRRSFAVVAASDRTPAGAPAGRRERQSLADSPWRRAFAGETCIGDGIRAFVAAPLPGASGVDGVLVATGSDGADGDRRELLTAVAAAVAPFVDSAMLLARNQEQERRRRAFQAIHQALAGSLDVRKVFDDIVDAVRPVFGFDIMGVELMNPSGRTSERIVEIGGNGQLPRIRTVDDFSVSTQLLAGQPVLVHDTHGELDPQRPGDRILLDAGIRSFVLVPLVFPLSPGERATGVIYLAKRRPFWFEPLDVETLRDLADPVTLAIHHHRRVEQHQRIAAAEARTRELQDRLATLKSELGARWGFERILGRSRPLRELLARASKVAPTETTVLVTGESGTGKELVAHAIHVASARADGPFVALNCAALPEALLESELFGHEKGAFTGAVKRKPGRFELAAGGTLFLDEIGELALPMQAKLLRVLQQREYQTIGGTTTMRADVRLVAATNRDLAAEVAAGRFREDLLYRLNVFQVHLPPLRERGDDVLLLAEHFVRELEASMGKSVPGISEQARRALLDYPWPGNVRELQNAIERALILSDGGLIQDAQLGLDPHKIAAARGRLAGRATGGAGGGAEGEALGTGARLPDWERRLVVEALEKAGGNKSRAAEILGVTRSQLYTRMKRFGL